jgi:hypothetical protein
MLYKKFTSYFLIILLSCSQILGDFIVYALSPNDIQNKVFFLDAQDIDNDQNNSNEPDNDSEIIEWVDKFNSNT